MLTLDLEPVDQYLRTFQWNKVKYRADKSLAELIDLLHKVCGCHLSIRILSFALMNQGILYAVTILMTYRRALVSTMTSASNIPNITRSRIR